MITLTLKVPVPNTYEPRTWPWLYRHADTLVPKGAHCSAISWLSVDYRVVLDFWLIISYILVEQITLFKWLTKTHESCDHRKIFHLSCWSMLLSQIVIMVTPHISWLILTMRYKECHLWIKPPRLDIVIYQEEMVQYIGCWYHALGVFQVINRKSIDHTQLTDPCEFYTTSFSRNNGKCKYIVISFNEFNMKMLFFYFYHCSACWV